MPKQNILPYKNMYNKICKWHDCKWHDWARWRWGGGGGHSPTAQNINVQKAKFAQWFCYTLYFTWQFQLAVISSKVQVVSKDVKHYWHFVSNNRTLIIHNLCKSIIFWQTDIWLFSMYLYTVYMHKKFYPLLPGELLSITSFLAYIAETSSCLTIWLLWTLPL